MQNNTEQPVYAGFFVRLAAYIIDWIIVGFALLFIRIPMFILSLQGGNFLTTDVIFQYSIYDILIYLLKVTYFILLTYFTGATIGKKLLQIRVVSSEKEKPTFFEIVFRETVGKFLSGITLFIGYIMIGADKKKHGLHDILSDTEVIYYHQKNIAIPTPVFTRKVQYAQPIPTPVMPNQMNRTVQNQMMPNQMNRTVQNQMMPNQMNRTVQNQMMPNQVNQSEQNQVQNQEEK